VPEQTRVDTTGVPHAMLRMQGLRKAIAFPFGSHVRVLANESPSCPKLEGAPESRFRGMRPPFRDEATEAMLRY